MTRRKNRVAHVGVDVSKDRLWVCWSGLTDDVATFDVSNDDAGVAEILKRTTAGRINETRIVVEATGPYSARLVSAAAEHPVAQVMRIRPADGKRFLQLVARAKTDRVDAYGLLEYAKRMEFTPTVLPSTEAKRIRSLARHLGKIIDRRAAVKNEKHAADIDDADVIDWAIEAEVSALDAIIDKLQAQIVEALQTLNDPRVQQAVETFQEIPGVSVRATARVLPELMCLPEWLTPRQVVAHVGLDPRPRMSGTSRNGDSWPISKMGNSRIRRVLYMNTMCAVRYEPAMKAFYEALVARGKPRKVALVATMRKLVVALWCMYTNGEAYAPHRLTSRAAA